MKKNESVKDMLFALIKNKKFQIGLTIVLFLAILISSTSLRMENLPVLLDQTTGLYTSNDLDSLYFYRVAETQINNEGTLPAFDKLRSPGYNVSWIPELIDNYLVWNYRILNFFNHDITFNYASTISAPIFYAIGLILFFILCLLLTKSKVASLISSAFLAYAPGFLFRSIAGFYDHDHVGVFVIFMFVIASCFAFKKFEKNYVNSTLFGILLGFLTSLVLVSWGGAITFVLVFFPLACFIYYLFNHLDKKKFILFYFVWLISSVLFTPVMGGSASGMYARFLDSQGIVSLFVLGYAIIDFLVTVFRKNLGFIKEKYHALYVLGTTFVLGIIGLMAIGKNPLTLVQKAWATLIYPFFGDFSGRLGATVAENAQPYLIDLISQNGKVLFWFFIIGLILISVSISSNSKNIKNKIILSGSTIFLLFAVLFSRYSSSALLNGENIISQALYLVGGLGFLAGVGFVYYKEKFEISSESIILLSLVITVAINARAAIRSFFLITPFMCLIAGYGLIILFSYLRRSKDETMRIISWIIIVILAFILLTSFFGNPLTKQSGLYQTVSTQAQYIGASVNVQWQNAMEWARNETPEDSIFVHWWDYGYFVQTLGERATVTDGGHSGGDPADHYIGRYVLTTPNPDTAFSFMKTWNVSYLLIDPTEMGKYGAFSKIGSNDSWDRISSGVFGGASDETQSQETASGLTRVYQLGGCVDEDIAYTANNSQVFLPGISITKTQQMSCNSYVAGAIVNFKTKDNKMSIEQPVGVYYYNNKQYRIPIKNVYANGQMVSFENGIDSVVYLIPKVDSTSGTMDNVGAMIYLSPRTFNSLMGRLYILDDYYNEYPTLSEAHFEDDPAVAYFKQFAGENLSEFIYYEGIRAPLKIWKVNYPAGTETHEEFLDIKSKLVFGGMDKYFE